MHLLSNHLDYPSPTWGIMEGGGHFTRWCRVGRLEKVKETLELRFAILRGAPDGGKQVSKEQNGTKTIGDTRS